MKNYKYAKLLSRTRINGSVNGNPNWEVILEMGDGKHEVMRSSSDCAWSYGFDAAWIGKSVAFTATRSGRINFMKKLELTDTFADPIFKEANA